MAQIRDIKSGRTGEPPREPMPRRLAAIVAGDISGYSRLMQIDEEGTHNRVKRLERDLIEPTIREHHGRLVKTTGDGFIAIFDSCPSIIGSNTGLASISATSSSKPTTSMATGSILRRGLRA
jgi:class 3 adenylate cyclase